MKMGVAIDFETIGDFPKYGNDDDRADDLAVNTVTFFSDETKRNIQFYRNSDPYFICFKRSHLMLCMVKKPDPHQMEENSENL